MAKNKYIYWLCGAAIALCAFGIFSLFIYNNCIYILMHHAELATFRLSSDYICDTLAQYGGAAKLLGELLCSYGMSAPSIACGIGAVLTLSFVALAAVAKRTSRHQWLWPLCLAPSAFQALLLCNPAYMPSAVASMFLVSSVLWLVLALPRCFVRSVVAAVMSAVLVWLAGASALVYAVGVCVCGAVINHTDTANRKKAVIASAILLLSPIIVIIGAYSAAYTGEIASIGKALSPASYCFRLAPAPSALWWPVIASFFVFAIASASRFIKVKSKIVATGITAVCAIAVVVLATSVASDCIDESRETDARISLLAANNDYDGIVTLMSGRIPDNTLQQNYLYLALAMQNRLADDLFACGCSGSESLLDTSVQTPEYFIMLSDIYYAIGHLSLARKVAFEANEAYGNLSPRLLKRLADTALIYGDYALADKYISLLQTMPSTAQWVADRKAVSGNDAKVAAHPQLGPKRQNLIPENRFAGSRGLADDLLQIQSANTANNVAMQYLGCWLLAIRNVPAFAATIQQLYDQGKLTHPLPRHFAEAMAVDHFASSTPLNPAYGITDDMLMRCKAFWADHQPMPGTYWAYLRQAPRQ